MEVQCPILVFLRDSVEVYKEEPWTGSDQMWNLGLKLFQQDGECSLNPLLSYQRSCAC